MSTRVKHRPTRTCAGCGRSSEKRDLVRVVRTPDGGVALDPSGKLPGRGAYVCPVPACWQRGIEKNRIAQSLKVTVSPAQSEVLLAAAKNFEGVAK